jgi:malate dehydrogenase
VLGAGGVERVLEVELVADERKLFDASVEHVRSLVAQIKL